MSEEVKFCKDCKHFRRERTQPEKYSKCAAEPEPVMGDPGAYCDLSRKYGPCGPVGRLWESKSEPRYNFDESPSLKAMTDLQPKWVERKPRQPWWRFW